MGYLVVPDPYQLAGLRRGTTASLQQCSGQALNGANVTGVSFGDTNLFGVVSGGITGTPSSLPSAWGLLNGYLIGAGAKLTDADLAGDNLTDYTLSNAIVTGANLAGVNLTGASLESIESGGIVGTPSALPTDWELISGYLFGPGTLIVGANLTGFNLSNLDLSGAEFNGSNFTGADLSDTNLTSADLFLTNMSDADLLGANATNTFVSFITWSNTTCPDGTNSDNDGDTCVNNLG
jgi:uncharacterized protein YjbI with pentapeptide repeats